MDELDPKAAELQSLIAKLNVYKNRGDKTQIQQIISEIAEKFPEDPIHRELEADRLIAIGNKKEAADILKEVIKQFPGRIETERKHAKLVFELGAGNFTTWEEEISREIRNTKSSGTAAVLSFIFPGTGQIYNEEYMKGFGFVAVALTLWIVFLGAGFTPTGDDSSKINNLGYGLVVGILLLGIGTAFEAGSRAGRRGKRVIPPRPVPPSDKPFE